MASKLATLAGSDSRKKFTLCFRHQSSSPRDNDQEAGVPRTDLGHVDLERIGRPFPIEFRKERVNFVVPGFADIPISFESQNQILRRFGRGSPCEAAVEVAEFVWHPRFEATAR